MKKIYVFFLLVIISLSVKAQLPEFEWANYSTGSGNVATYAYASCYDNSGNSFVLGAFNNQSSTLDIDPSPSVVSLSGYVGMFIAKYDPTGQMLWGKQIQITTMQVQSSVSPRNIACDDSGNVYITGGLVDVYVDFDLSSALNPIDTTSGGFDLFLAKYTPAGNLDWSLLLGSTAHEEGNSIVCDGNNVYLGGQYGCGTDFDPGPGTHIPPISQFCVSGFLACYTSNGDFVWQNSYCGPSLSSAGYAIPENVAMDSHHDLIICGKLGGVVDFNPGAGLDTLSVQPTGGADGYFAKYDTSGNFIFAKALVTISDYVYPVMTVDRSDNIVIAGGFSGIVDFDPSSGVYKDTSTNYNLNTGTDGFIAKYDNNGIFLWEKSFGTMGTEDLVTVATDSADHIFIGGQFTDVMDVDCGPGTYTLSDVNNGTTLDGFAVKYDENGNVVFGFVVSGFAYDNVSSIACYEDKFIATGKFSQAWDFDPTAGVQTVLPVTTNGNNYFHVQYYDTALVAAVPPIISNSSRISVYPNPATDFLRVDACNNYERVSIWGIRGELIRDEKSSPVIDVRELSPGVYVLVLTDFTGNSQRATFVKH